MNQKQAKLHKAFLLKVELRDRGRFGFLLPRVLIIPTAHEAFNGIRAMAQTLMHNARRRRR